MPRTALTEVFSPMVGIFLKKLMQNSIFFSAENWKKSGGPLLKARQLLPFRMKGLVTYVIFEEHFIGLNLTEMAKNNSPPVKSYEYFKIDVMKNEQNQHK